MEKDKRAWKSLETEYPLDNEWLRVRKEKVKLPNGKILDDFYTVENREAVAILAIDSDGRFVLAEQYRHAVNAATIDLPSGRVEEGERPIDAAERELAEETGLAAGSLKELLTYYPDSGKIDCLKHIFLAEDLREIGEGAPDKDENEDIRLVRLSLLEISTKIQLGELKDACLFVALAAYLHSRPQDWMPGCNTPLTVIGK